MGCNFDPSDPNKPSPLLQMLELGVCLGLNIFGPKYLMYLGILSCMIRKFSGAIIVGERKVVPSHLQF